MNGAVQYQHNINFLLLNNNLLLHKEKCFLSLATY